MSQPFDEGELNRMRAIAGLEQSISMLGEADKILKMRRDRLVEEGWSVEAAERISAEFLIDLQRVIIMAGMGGQRS